VSCDKIETDINVFYDGRDATEEEKDEMFALLTEILQAQRASGSFAGAGTVESVKAVSTESNSGDKDVPAGLTAGVVVAAVAVIAALVSVYCCCFKKERTLVVDNGPDSSHKQDQHHTDDSSVEGGAPVEVQATLIEEKYEEKKK